MADTAFSVAAVRADEGARPDGERLFVDPFAATFAAAGTHAAESTQRFLDMPFFREGIRLRTRFIDDCVREGLAAGLDQLVLLGAGFDARALRMREVVAHGAEMFEIDTPEQLDRKRAALVGNGIAIPDHVRFVPFDVDTPDFEEELGAALEIAGFRAGAGAMFVWEGVIGYVDDAAIDRSLRLMAGVGGTGSRLAFQFADETFLGIEAMAVRARRCGFATFDEIGADVLWRKHLPGEPHPNAWVVKMALATV
ncbi:MAG TPA: SAM-dependent methyltransferase [Polyangiaceae bacterium]